MASSINGHSEPANHNADCTAKFQDLIQQVSEGADDAVWRLIDEYGNVIFRAVRRSLKTRLRQRFDSEDFVQLVWKSFFGNPDLLKRFSTPEDMAGYLAGMARYKVSNETRRSLVRPTVNMNRERYINDSNEDIGGSLQSSDSKPIDIVIARESYDLFMQDKPEHYRKIVQMKIAGHKLSDIAFEVGVDERTVRRILKKLCEEIDG